MNKRITWILLSCLIVVALVLASCTTADTGPTEGQTITGKVTDQPTTTTPTTTVAGREMVTDPVTGKQVTAPEYGGTITIGDYYVLGEGADCYSNYNTGGRFNNGVVEPLAVVDWTLDRDIYDFTIGTTEPSLMVGCLAESWEILDPTTFVFHIRQGVHWHDKPPMNGREFTAYDVEHHYNRFLGMGQFSEAGPGYTIDGLEELDFVSIEAIDKWTVVFKTEDADMWTLSQILTHHCVSRIYPPEVIDLYGNMEDWNNQVGTGPFMVTDYVEGSSLTFEKNPNYWGYDEKYPENRLPYVDRIRLLTIPDEAARLAALRSGKLDLITTAISSVDVVDSLARTNPEIVQYTYRGGDGGVNGYCINQELPILGDVRVRTALQMAIDLETINDLYYKGRGFWKPMGSIGDPMHHIPFDEWPEDVKQEYTYNPAGAEALLDAAGYTRGADGIRFKTEINLHDLSDPSYSDLVMSYWREIGVDAELQITPGGEFWQTVYMERNYSFVNSEAGNLRFGPFLLTRYSDEHSMWFTVGWNKYDTAYDSLITDFLAANTMDEYWSTAWVADWYTIENHFQIWGVEAPLNQAAQPYIKGWNGERTIGGVSDAAIGINSVIARLWIDHEMKKAMGY